MAEVKIALLGIGNRAVPKVPETSNFLGWAGQIAKCPGVKLVAAQDPDEQARVRIVERGLLESGATFVNAQEMLSSVDVDALLVCTPARFHSEGVELAIRGRKHVLVEKPFVADAADGERLVRGAKEAGIVTTVVQNWRYKDVGRRMREAIRSGELGTVGQIFFRYVRNRENPNYPAYIFEEEYPMLYAMGSHHLDLFRFLLGEEMVCVRGESFRPPWSMYKTLTGHSITLRSESGVFISYVGTISSKNSGLPQESLVVEGSRGTLVNDSDWSEPPVLLYRSGQKEPVDITCDVENRSMRAQYDAADAFILGDFIDAIGRGGQSDCPLEDSFKSLELVEACRQACEGGAAVTLPRA